ncbi:AT-hook motif nuclear-localized protein 10-like [Magnolia sinica]|uniref:AT-hook motif nuclear-localized protein 10-like n=1 Tax=Magnolia sinica TaxID=86752 RepID=UPI00265A1500|nr:AT-hook motif nuclear-localized protein 10-like [Magnolia sinica]
MDSREGTRLSSSEPPGMMLGSNSYGGGLQNSSMVSPNSAGMMQAMRSPFNSVVPSGSKLGDSMNSGYHGDMPSGMRPCGFSMSEPIKKKRGRPRKYGPDGSMALALTPLSSVSGHLNAPSSEPMIKRRGRPPGSGKKQQLEALGSAGIAFTPHVITVKAGEDVASKIMAFSQQGSRTVCILSANGAIGNVTLRQPATSGGTVSYEGRFEIISLSGSFILTENDGTRSRTGGLSVSLAGSDGRVLGGGVAGMLMAASPVQVVMGSFIAEGKKPKPEPMKREPSSTLLQMAGLGAAAASSLASQGSTSESSDEPSSPASHSTGALNNTGHPNQHMPPYPPVGWPGSHSASQHRHEPNMRMYPN